MAVTVAVARDLSPFAETLRRHGYNVVDLPSHDGQGLADGVDAVVVSGMDNGIFGMWTTEPPIPVLDADGKSPNELADELRQTLGSRGSAG